MIKRFCLLLFITMVLSSCGLTKKDLGMARNTPDESKVVARDKLVLPPDYNIRPERSAE